MQAPLSYAVFVALAASGALPSAAQPSCAFESAPGATPPFSFTRNVSGAAPLDVNGTVVLANVFNLTYAIPSGAKCTQGSRLTPPPPRCEVPLRHDVRVVWPARRRADVRRRVRRQHRVVRLPPGFVWGGAEAAVRVDWLR